MKKTLNPFPHPDPLRKDLPYYNYELEQSDIDAGLSQAFITGAVSSLVSLGTVAYDTTEDWIAIRPEHYHPLTHAIDRILESAGRVPPGTHVCHDLCNGGLAPAE